MTKNDPGGRKAGDKTASTSSRKPYQAPRLTVYGDLHRIAQAKGGSKNDGGGSPATKV
jgi:hypothetical protein